MRGGQDEESCVASCVACCVACKQNSQARGDVQEEVDGGRNEGWREQRCGYLNGR